MQRSSVSNNCRQVLFHLKTKRGLLDKICPLRHSHSRRPFYFVNEIWKLTYEKSCNIIHYRLIKCWKLKVSVLKPVKKAIYLSSFWEFVVLWQVFIFHSFFFTRTISYNENVIKHIQTYKHILYISDKLRKKL